MHPESFLKCKNDDCLKIDLIQTQVSHHGTWEELLLTLAAHIWRKNTVESIPSLHPLQTKASQEKTQQEQEI